MHNKKSEIEMALENGATRSDMISWGGWRCAGELVSDYLADDCYACWVELVNESVRNVVMIETISNDYKEPCRGNYLCRVLFFREVLPGELGWIFMGEFCCNSIMFAFYPGY